MAARRTSRRRDGVQHLLARAAWDADAVRDDLLAYVGENLGEPDGVLIVDETGFLKKGKLSCGVGRQFSGSAGRIENSQIGVFLAYFSGKGRALVDRALYLPKEWTDDPERLRKAGVPQDQTFATKITLAKKMMLWALDAGLLARFVTADAVYGSDYAFRRTIESRGLGYVLGARSDFAARIGFEQLRVGALLKEAPPEAWMRRSAGDGSKGPRYYNRALIRANAPDPEEYARWILFRRSVSDPADVAYFACGGPAETTLEELVRVAGSRWAVEECYELAKGCCGLDEYEVRSWTGWHRHATLSMFALAAAALVRSRAADEKGGRARPPERAGGAEAPAPRRLERGAADRPHAGLESLAEAASTPRPRLPLP